MRMYNIQNNCNNWRTTIAFPETSRLRYEEREHLKETTIDLEGKTI